MKESQLAKEIFAPINATKSNLKKIIDNCYQTAKKFGEGKSREENGYTREIYDFEEGNIAIHLDDLGYYPDDIGYIAGEGKIIVEYNGKRVLHCDRGSVGIPKYNNNPKVYDFCVLEYWDGKWEKTIENILKNKIKKENKEKIVDASIVKRLREKFGKLKE